MIYGAQQTIKLIRLCVFPEEGPAGGCSRPSSAPSLFEPPLPSTSLPPESLEHFFSPPSRCAREIPPAADPRGPFRLLVPNAAPGLRDIGPIAVRVLKLTAAHHTMVLSQRDFGLRPLFTLPSLLHLPQTPNLRRKSGCGMMPIEGAHCFTSCPVRHTPEHLYPTGSERRFWSQQEVWWLQRTGKTSLESQDLVRKLPVCFSSSQ